MKGLITAPKKLKSTGVKRLMEDALWTQGLRKKLEDPVRDAMNFKQTMDLENGSRHRCELAGMKPINIEKIDESFYWNI